MIIEATDFAGPKIDGRYNFGRATQELVAVALEKLIAGVRDGRVLMQDVVVSTKVRNDDWTMTTLSFSYVESDVPRKFKDAAADTYVAATEPGDPIKALYGAGAFPIEIRRVTSGVNDSNG